MKDASTTAEDHIMLLHDAKENQKNYDRIVTGHHWANKHMHIYLTKFTAAVCAIQSPFQMNFGLRKETLFKKLANSMKNGPTYLVLRCQQLLSYLFLLNLGLCVIVDGFLGVW